MKLALLIVAHDQPAHFGKLVRKFNGEWVKIYVHIDRRVDVNVFEKAVGNQKNIVFLKGGLRKKVKWGGFSQVEATLNLLYVSRSSGCAFTRFCLISGSDYPIKDTDYIRRAFESQSEYIRIDRKIENTAECRFFYQYVGRYHCLDNPIISRLLKHIPISRKIPDELTLYHGSNWWALTDSCVDYIFTYLEENEKYKKFHRHTLCVDEIFFSSIVKNSPYAHKIIQDFSSNGDLKNTREANCYASHYIDWSDQNSSSPKTLNEDDASVILQSDALFARKFRCGLSDALLDIVNDHIDGGDMHTPESKI